ncbi:MAG: YkgJ family cysteine cluster protein [Candidatus Caenarcaniphilales bacterium]|jgi:Fe-S-cluster containining protein|nr:YkgJ family cysteine cluster protein [Candidatus Caenarcaniphilales bacterium]
MAKDSGLSYINLVEFQQREYLRYLGWLAIAQYSKITDELEASPEKLSTLNIKAIFLLALLFQKRNIMQMHISVRPLDSDLLFLISLSLKKNYSLLKNNLLNAVDIDFTSLENFLPGITNIEIIDSSSVLDSSRINLEFFVGNNISTNQSLKEFYEDFDLAQKQVIEKVKFQNICFENHCNDCCIKTPPQVSLIEFEYIKANVDLEKYREKAEVLFDESLEIIDQMDSYKNSNPHNLEIRCPFLADDNRCEIHEFRPLACRAYGLSTIDGHCVQACNHYLGAYQGYSATDRPVVDSRPYTQVMGKANSKLAKASEYSYLRQPVALLVAWLKEFSDRRKQCKY